MSRIRAAAGAVMFWRGPVGAAPPVLMAWTGTITAVACRLGKQAFEVPHLDVGRIEVAAAVANRDARLEAVVPVPCLILAAVVVDQMFVARWATRPMPV